MTFCDPTPDGWKYGFPKPYNPRENETAKDWAIRNGYPKELADKSYTRYRFWEQ